jgi:hypothetical protein
MRVCGNAKVVDFWVSNTYFWLNNAREKIAALQGFIDASLNELGL